jgi:hypothetical protein
MEARIVWQGGIDYEHADYESMIRPVPVVRRAR